MEAQSCPNCTASTVMAGCFAYAAQVDGGGGFVPGGMRGLRTSVGMFLPATFLYCLSCGHLWTNLAPKKVRRFIEKHGTSLVRQNYEAAVSGRYHGLPDVPEAREAADKVAEIDALVLAGKDGEAIRRYRDLTGITWDQALALVPGWHELDRARKLALCGWCPKDSPRFEKSELCEHPMLDRWLDG